MAAFDVNLDRVATLINEFKSLTEYVNSFIFKGIERPEYNYLHEEITIEADRGAIHERTIGIMSCWLGNIVESNRNVHVSLREGTLVHTPH